MQNIDTLNEQFGITGQLQFIEDSGFIMVDINNKYANARISTYAGQVISYQPHTEQNDLIFLSENAVYQTGKTIRGGVPICWPWFGDDTSGYGRPSHGFMRNQQWQVIASNVDLNGVTTLILGASSTDKTKAIWPYEFKLTLEIKVGQSLQLKLTTQNTGNKEFAITQAFHTYFNISDVEQITVSGLDGKKYLDKLEGFSESLQMGDVTVSAEIDRVFQAVDKDIYLIDKGFDRKITFSVTGCKTTVIWNPWTSVSSRMTDLNNDDHRRFVCVETANTAKDSVVIAAGKEHSLSVIYTIT
ncbi:MAG: D-hexose-6-phosphate mutarotase [Methylophaga sp.]|nr:MAG: D-hexose-6-phosphate mutarotase [Methylophaga sp.]